MKSNLSEKAAIAMLLTTVIVWASAFVAIRALLPYFSPANIALGRFLIASVCFAVYAVFYRIEIPPLRDMLIIGLLGFLSITVYHLALNFGEKTVASGEASVIIALSPVMIAVLSRFVLGERLTGMQKIGIAAAFGGVFFLSDMSFSLDVGVIYILIAAVASSVSTVFQKPLLEKYKAVDLIILSIWFGTLFLLPFAPSLYQDCLRITPAGLLPMLWLGIFPSAISYTLWMYVLHRFPANKCASYLYLSPVFAFIIGWIWLGEKPDIRDIIGGCIILMGVMLVNRKSVKK